MKPLLFLISLLTINPLNAQTCKDYIPDQHPDTRYTVHPNQTVTDNIIALMWKQCSEGQSGSNCSGTASTMNWQAALNAANNSNFAGYTDWRLPNIKELASLAKLNCYNPAINVTIFPNTLPSSFWSSSPHSNSPRNAWLLDFYYGHDSSSKRSNANRIRLVRPGQ